MPSFPSNDFPAPSLDPANSSVNWLAGISARPGGGLVVGGVDVAGRAALRALTADGSSDTAFGPSGTSYASASSGLTQSGSNALHTRPDGSFVLVSGTPGTSTWSADAGDDFAVVSFTAAGLPDTAFGAGGVQTAGFGSNADWAMSALTADGRLVVLGTTNNMAGAGEDLALARFHGGETAAARIYARQDANFNVTSTIRLTGADPAGTAADSVERYAYTPYGVRVVLSADFAIKPEGSTLSAAGASGWNYGFQSGRLDGAIGRDGVYNYRQRYYDPDQGRWTQQDPAGYIDGGSRYSFVDNQPLSYVDPTGERLIDVNYNAFIGNTHNSTFGPWIGEPMPIPGGWVLSDVAQFLGDDRGFGQFSAGPQNARLATRGYVESTMIGRASSPQSAGGLSTSGLSHRRWRRRLLGIYGSWHYDPPRQAVVDNWEVKVSNPGPCVTALSFSPSASYPFVPASPAVSYSVTATFAVVKKDTVKVSVKGLHALFPDAESYVDGALSWTFLAPGAGPTPAAFAERVPFSYSVVVHAPTPSWCCAKGD